MLSLIRQLVAVSRKESEWLPAWKQFCDETGGEWEPGTIWKMPSIEWTMDGFRVHLEMTQLEEGWSTDLVSRVVNAQEFAFCLGRVGRPVSLLGPAWEQVEVPGNDPANRVAAYSNVPEELERVLAAPDLCAALLRQGMIVRLENLPEHASFQLTVRKSEVAVLKTSTGYADRREQLAELFALHLLTLRRLAELNLVTPAAA